MKTKTKKVKMASKPREVRKTTGKAAKMKKVTAKKTKPAPEKKAVKAVRKTPVASAGKSATKTVSRTTGTKMKPTAGKSTKAKVKTPEIKQTTIVKPAPSATAAKRFRKAELTKLKVELLGERNQLVKEIENLDNITHTNGEDVMVENRAYSIHMAENASENEAINMALGLRKILLERLTGINHALERLEDGNYGICARCGCAIDMERLIATPQAVLCVQCRRQVEAERRGTL